MKNAFSLMEILVTIALIAIISVAVLVAINPTGLFQSGRNTQRESHIARIYTSVNSYLSDEGTAIGDLGTVPDCNATAVLGSSGITLASVITAGYIAELPLDPSTGTVSDTGYEICKTSATKIMVLAPNAEGNVTIEIK